MQTVHLARLMMGVTMAALMASLIALGSIDRIIDVFAGTRETSSYHIILLNYTFRKRALIEGRRLVQEGRLDAAEDVFDLTFRDR